jgi:1-acyl-sn-glycerol-3-phosphate acyltransferase
MSKVTSFIKSYTLFCIFDHMKIVKIAFWIVFRVWFYTMILVPLFVMSPFMTLAIAKEKWYPYFFVMARIWGKFILFMCGFYYKVETEETLESNKSYMFIANHTSMTDIMLMLAVIDKPFVFVGKASLAKFPVFGFFYKRSCILVDRSDPKSRYAVFNLAQNRIKQGLSICIFPEGGVPSDELIELADFKDGAFRLAVEHGIPVVPITFADNKKRFSYTFFSGGPGLMRVKIHKPIVTAGRLLGDRRHVKTEARDIILMQLQEFHKAES